MRHLCQQGRSPKAHHNLGHLVDSSVREGTEDWIYSIIHTPTWWKREVGDEAPFTHAMALRDDTEPVNLQVLCRKGQGEWARHATQCDLLLQVVSNDFRVHIGRLHVLRTMALAY